MPGGESESSAEIVINMERVRDVGDDHQGYHRELALYLAHGCNHLTGVDDQTPADRRLMRRRERRWINQADELGMLTDLCQPADRRA